MMADPAFCIMYVCSHVGEVRGQSAGCVELRMRIQRWAGSELRERTGRNQPQLSARVTPPLLPEGGRERGREREQMMVINTIIGAQYIKFISS